MFRRFSNISQNTNKIIYKKFNQKINDILINPNYITFANNIRDKSTIIVNSSTVLYSDKKLYENISIEIDAIINKCKNDLHEEYTKEIAENYYARNIRYMEQDTHSYDIVLNDYSKDVKKNVCETIYNHMKNN